MTQQANETPNDLSHDNAGELADLRPTKTQEADIKGGDASDFSAIVFVGGWGASMSNPPVRPLAAGALTKP